MNIFDWIYINIYGQTQQLGNMNRSKIDGNLWTSSIFGISIGGLYLFFVTLFYYKIYNIPAPKVISNKYATIFIALITTILVKSFYEKGDRSFRMYIKLKESDKLMTKTQVFYLIMMVGMTPYMLWLSLFVLFK